MSGTVYADGKPRLVDRHSDKRKFYNDLNKQKGCELSECVLKVRRKFEDFQAEYEGSIPFTRSICFPTHNRSPDRIVTSIATSSSRSKARLCSSFEKCGRSQDRSRSRAERLPWSRPATWHPALVPHWRGARGAPNLIAQPLTRSRLFTSARALSREGSDLT